MSYLLEYFGHWLPTKKRRLTNTGTSCEEGAGGATPAAVLQGGGAQGWRVAPKDCGANVSVFTHLQGSGQPCGAVALGTSLDTNACTVALAISAGPHREREMAAIEENVDPTTLLNADGLITSLRFADEVPGPPPTLAREGTRAERTREPEELTLVRVVRGRGGVYLELVEGLKELTHCIVFLRESLAQEGLGNKLAGQAATISSALLGKDLPKQIDMSSSLDSQQERSRRSPVIDVDRFLRIGRQAGKGRERRARVVDRRSDKDDASASSSSSSSSCSYVSEPARRVRVAERADVLVVGGGCAGLAAAVAAKKVSPSLNVLLVEKEEYLGGTISRVGMESVSWWMYNDAVKSDGLVKELEDLATSMQGTTTFPYNEGLNLTSEPFKRVADAFVTRHGVRCLFATWVADTIVEASPGSSSGDPVPCLKGVYVENVAGRQAILAERVVDCTGNADVLHRAGGRFTVLPVDQRMGITQVFSVSNVDRERFLEYTERKAATYNNWGNDGGPKVCETEWKQETQGSEGELRTPYLEREFQEAEVKGIVPKGSNINGSWSTLTHDGELLNLNLVHMQGDALDPWDMSEMAQVGREKVGEAIKALKTIPGCEDAKLRTFSNNLGVRDSRKCVAKYNLSGEDALAGSRFEDSVCVLPQIVDGYGILVLGSEGGEVEVPLRGFQCDVDNLMVAGRCFAGDHVSHCLTRNIKCCMLTGQAAGAIAATSLRTKTSVWNVRPQDVREDLTRVGFRCDAHEK
ncbi:FAD dependent oxidoreductase [Chloropicon primus]|uniref:FAD dependent oxidoreductase n=1 Tax=Chloropicon primus TaxID=1764295 RepID=A0A5B8MN02_9CHLO|nr:FAD dependent oxidoreductase [Chloropicon primus]UPR00872.1 FAD dependent oxidoreductase [Chloropicon primus]|eukprot:QDZ21661.1 FAD dependent oxidoreductase [Chloropicon primus]